MFPSSYFDLGHIFSFQIAYPSWEPDSKGKQVLASLKTFRDRNFQHQGTTNPCRSSRIEQQKTNFGGTSTGNSFLSKEIPLHHHLAGFHQLDSMWLVNGEQKNFPYILDWYYSCQNHDQYTNSRDVSRTVEKKPTDFWAPTNFPPKEANYDDNWDSLFEDRVQSHLEASASGPTLQQSVLQHHGSTYAEHSSRRSHWWARTRAQAPDALTSFLEPPSFYHGGSQDRNGKNSDESEDEPEQRLDWRNSSRLSRTFFMDDLDGAQFDMPFDDIYRVSDNSTTGPRCLISSSYEQK